MKKSNYSMGVFFAVSILCSVNLYGQEQDIEEEISVHNIDFDVQVENNPELNMDSEFIFKKKVKLRDMKGRDALSDVDGMEILGLKHSYGENTGGYILEHGQTATDIADTYENELIFMFTSMIQSFTDDLENEKNRERKRNIRESIRDLRGALRSIEREGVEVVGMDVRGQGKKLRTYKNKNRRKILVSKIKTNRGRISSPSEFNQ